MGDNAKCANRQHRDHFKSYHQTSICMPPNKDINFRFNLQRTESYLIEHPFRRGPGSKTNKSWSVQRDMYTDIGADKGNNTI